MHSKLSSTVGHGFESARVERFVGRNAWACVRKKLVHVSLGPREELERSISLGRGDVRPYTPRSVNRPKTSVYPEISQATQHQYVPNTPPFREEMLQVTRRKVHPYLG